MLRLLQNKLSSRSLFFREIVAFVTFLHIVLIALFCLLGFQQYKNERFTVRSQSQLSSTIVFLPLKKYVDPAMNAGKKKGGLQKHQSRKIIDYQSYLENQGYNVASESASKKEPAKKKALKKAKSKPKVAKKTAVKPVKKKAVPKKKSPAKKKVVAKKKAVAPKPAAKKEVQKAVEKSPVKKKAVETKKVAAKKAEVEKKAVQEEQAVETKSAAKTEEKKVEVAALSQENRAESKTVEGVDLSDVTFVGYRELDTLQLQSKIQLAVEQYWSPPVGMPQKTVCELQVTIEKAGKVVGAKVIKSSKIMAFDLAARSAIHKTKFPQDVWGKQITVELGI